MKFDKENIPILDVGGRFNIISYHNIKFIFESSYNGAASTKIISVAANMVKESISFTPIVVIRTSILDAGGRFDDITGNDRVVSYMNNNITEADRNLIAEHYNV